MLSVNIYFDMWSIYILYAWSVFEKYFLQGMIFQTGSRCTE